jgi:hypothetical protein
MKKSQKPETKKKLQQAQKEETLNKELLKVEKAFATGLRAGPDIKNGGNAGSDDDT